MSEACGLCAVNAIYASGAFFWWLAGASVLSLFMLNAGKYIFTNVIPNERMARKMEVASVLVFGFFVILTPVFFIFMIHNLLTTSP